MFRLLRISLASMILLTLAACAPNTPTVAPTVEPATRAPASTEFDASRALEHNRMLAETIGARVAGSENGMRAGDYIAQQFASYGYAIEKQTFTFEGWEDLGTRRARGLYRGESALRGQHRGSDEWQVDAAGRAEGRGEEGK